MHSFSSVERQQLLSLFKLSALPRIHVLSDLHLERGAYELPSGLDFDVLVAAGDIGNVEQAIKWLASIGKPVVYVLGNHERYAEDIVGAVVKAKALAKGTQVHVLDRDKVVIAGVRFLGATLWTDLRGMDPTFVHGAWNCMNDYLDITADQWHADARRAKRLSALCKRHKLQGSNVDPETGKLRLHPGMTYLEHQESVRWLKRQLAAPFDGPTVVVSHHAPSFESLRQHGIDQATLDTRRWAMRDTTPAKIAGYASELLGRLEEEQRRAVTLWVHGHTHTAMDYIEHGVRVLTNPRGRPYRKLPEGDLAKMHEAGYRFDQKRLDELRERERTEPYAGDGRDFEAGLTVDLLEGLERPIERALAPLAVSMEALVQEMAELLPHTATGTDIPARCVDEAFSLRLKQLDALLETAQEKSIRVVDRHAGRSSLAALQGPQAPYLRTPWPGDAPLTRADYRTAYAESVAALQWTRGAHRELRRMLLAWGAAVRLGLQALKRAGHRAQVAALELPILRDVSRLDMHVQLDVPGELDASGYHGVNERPAYEVLERVLNGNTVPRRWMASFYIPEDLEGRLLREEDLALIAPAEPAKSSRRAYSLPESQQVGDATYNF